MNKDFCLRISHSKFKATFKKCDGIAVENFKSFLPACEYKTVAYLNRYGPMINVHDLNDVEITVADLSIAETMTKVIKLSAAVNRV